MFVMRMVLCVTLRSLAQVLVNWCRKTSVWESVACGTFCMHSCIMYVE